MQLYLIVAQLFITVVKSCFKDSIFCNNELKNRRYWLCHRNKCDLNIFLHYCAENLLNYVRKSFCDPCLNCIVEEMIYLDLNAINNKCIK